MQDSKSSGIYGIWCLSCCHWVVSLPLFEELAIRGKKNAAAASICYAWNRLIEKLYHTYFNSSLVVKVMHKVWNVTTTSWNLDQSGGIKFIWKTTTTNSFHTVPQSDVTYSMGIAPSCYQKKREKTSSSLKGFTFCWYIEVLLLFWLLEFTDVLYWFLMFMLKFCNLALILGLKT